MLGALLTGCEKEPLVEPTADEVATYYSYSGQISFRMNGNVAEVIVQQPTDQLIRGGALWARLGPYIFLFTSETQRLFADYSGLAGVRVITLDGVQREVARALLTRDTLNPITWPRAINVASVARRDGTSQPSRMQQLVRFGEQNTQFSYSSRYVN